jgi:hypothetical protein
MYIEVIRPVQRGGGKRHLGREDHEQKDMGDIQGPGAFECVGRGKQPAVAVHRAAIRQAGAVAGQQHEHLGGVAQGVVPQAQDGNPVVRDVVGEDPPERQAAEEIDPRVAAGADQRHMTPCDGAVRS